MREIAAGVGLALTITGGQSVAQGALVQLAGARGHLVEQQPAQVERREAGVARVADLGLDGERLLAALAGLGVAADVAPEQAQVVQIHRLAAALADHVVGLAALVAELPVGRERRLEIAARLGGGALELVARAAQRALRQAHRARRAGAARRRPVTCGGGAG